VVLEGRRPKSPGAVAKNRIKGGEGGDRGSLRVLKRRREWEKMCQASVDQPGFCLGEGNQKIRNSDKSWASPSKKKRHWKRHAKGTTQATKHPVWRKKKTQGAVGRGGRRGRGNEKIPSHRQTNGRRLDARFIRVKLLKRGGPCAGFWQGRSTSRTYSVAKKSGKRLGKI